MTNMFLSIVCGSLPARQPLSHHDGEELKPCASKFDHSYLRATIGSTFVA